MAPHHQRFVTVVIDYHSGYPEVLLSGDITSDRLVKWLTQLFACYGNPDALVTDNGRQFVSYEFCEFLRCCNIVHITSAVYNPQQNGRVKVWNRFLKNSIQTFQGRNFEQGIQALLMSYRAISLTLDGHSPAEIMFNHKICTNAQPALRMQPAPKPQPASDNTTGNSTETPMAGHAHLRGPYRCGDFVCTKLPHIPKGTSPFSTPRQVMSILSNFTYELDNGQVWNACKLVRICAPPLPGITIDLEEMARRRSLRTNFGIPPKRLLYHHMLLEAR